MRPHALFSQAQSHIKNDKSTEMSEKIPPLTIIAMTCQCFSQTYYLLIYLQHKC